MTNAVNPPKLEPLMTALSWAYDKAVNGIPKFDRAEDLAANYLAKFGTVEDAIDSLISYQIGKATVAGFLAGIGGVVMLPVAVPANLASVLWIQIRMIAAIAHIRGFDIRSDQVKTLVLACLAGSSAIDVLKGVGVNVGGKLTQRAISSIAGATLMRINKAVGFRLLAKTGTTATINLSKLVPFVGGAVGGAVDGFVTREIGKAASRLFGGEVPVPPEPHVSSENSTPVVL
jgi:uncharacterized protein (DUF697 family)